MEDCAKAALLSAVLLLTIAGDAMVTVQLNKMPVAQANLPVYERYAGNYQLAPRRIISLGPFSESDNYPLFYDSQTRRTGVLYPVSETEFTTGTLDERHFLAPADLKVKFIKNQLGVVTGLMWQEGNARPIKGSKISPHRSEEVTFHNGEVTLRGTLTLPSTAGPHPVVIMLQEAGPRLRPFGMWPYLFVHSGIAMLTFDKRGSGSSTGDWQTASFKDLAGDAIAAINLLRSRTDIDPKQIGIWGNSNSGWYVPLVATQSRDVAFVINRVGSSLPPTDNVLYEIESQMREQRFSEDEIQRAVNLRRMLQNAVINNTGWAQFLEAATEERNERWFSLSRVGRYVAAPLPPNDLTLQQWRAPLDFNPIEFWEKVTCPVLAIYGELDQDTPTTRNIPPLIKALKKADNKDYTVIVLPKVGHPFFEDEASSNGYYWNYPPRQKYAAGYVDGMMDWLTKRVRIAIASR